MRQALRRIFDPTVLTVAVCYGLLLRLAAAAGLFGLWLGILVMLSLWRYAYAVLRDAARGRQRLPAPGVDTMNPVGEFGLLLHFALFASLAYLLFTTPLLGSGPLVTALRYVAGTIVLAAFPASAAIMGITRNVAAAIDPASIAQVISVMRRRYASLLGTAAALAVLANVLSARLDLLGGPMGLVAYVLETWLLLALFALTGAAVCSHGDEFDLPSVAAMRSADLVKERERDWLAVLDRAYGSIRSGMVQEGYQSIRALAAAEHEDPAFYQWLFNRMLDWEDVRHAVAIGGRFVDRLVETGRIHDALELADQCLRLSPALTLPRARIAELTDYARSIGRHRVADELAGVAARTGTAER